MARSSFFVTVLLSIPAFLAGCGGLSQEDAELRCKQQRQADQVCIDDAAYQQCVSCYEDCGDSCEAQLSCPSKFVCPE